MLVAAMLALIPAPARAQRGAASRKVAGATAPDGVSPRDACDDAVRPPRGWKSARAACLYRDARRAEHNAAFEECSQRARTAFELEDRADVRMTANRCLERAGRWVDALAGYEEALKTEALARTPNQAQLARVRAASLRRKMPKIALTIPPNARDLVVSVGSVVVPPEQLGQKIPVDPGKTTIVAKATIGDKTARITQEVQAVEYETIVVPLRFEGQWKDARVARCLARATSRAQLSECLGAPDAGDPGSSVVGTLGTEVTGYHGSDSVDVLSPALAASLSSPTGGWSIGGAFLVDVVTTASPDIVSTASPRWTEVRYAPSLHGSHKFGPVEAGLRGGFSREPDYLATVGGATLAIDLADKTITPMIGYEFSYDVLGRAGTSFDVFSRKITRHAFDAGTTFILGRATFVSLAVTAILEEGDTSKPYRYVPMFTPAVAETLEPGTSIEQVNALRNSERVLEQLPPRRRRWAAGARFAHRFSASTLRLDERLYIDDWGLRATTSDLRFIVDLGERLRVWPHGRFHAQSGVDFWRLAYTSELGPAGGSVPSLRTGDRELGPLWALTGGGGARVALGEDKAWGLTLAGDATYTSFLEHLFIRERVGLFGALTLDVELR